MSVNKHRLQIQLLSLHPLGVDPNMIWSTSCKNENQKLFLIIDKYNRLYFKAKQKMLKLL